ncbi:MAG: hypothetical protein AAF850_02960 [Pseudomonadota bacterium]
MSDVDFEALIYDIKLELQLLRQRRPWIYRELASSDKQRHDSARDALVEAIAAVLERYAIRKHPGDRAHG